jgi:fucose permease
MKYWRLKLSLILNYIVFAMLLNSVGTVILQVQNNFGVSKSAASVLEAFKDLPIAITSFLIASFVIRIGYKRTMLMGLALVAIMCMIMPVVPHFWMTKLLFLSIGVGFAFIKVSVFATIGLVSDNEKEHTSFMSFLESFFMVGVLSGYFIFSAFVNQEDPSSTSWMKVYYLLGALAVLAFILLLSTRLDESAVHKTESSGLKEDVSRMLELIILPLVIVFVVSIFFYVLVEQSIMSWLPTFNNQILQLPSRLSIEMASILAGSTALGRFLAGLVLKSVKWYWVVGFSLLAAATMVLVGLPLALQTDASGATGWFDAPIAVFIFPLIGLFLAPIYPTINSVMLSRLPVERHAPMSGLIVVFSALGGTTGSIITGNVFEHFGGHNAFYLSLVPISLIMIALFIFKRMTDRQPVFRKVD